MQTKTERTKTPNPLAKNPVVKELVEKEKNYNFVLTLLNKAFSIEENIGNNELLIKFKKIIPGMKNTSDLLIKNAYDSLSSNAITDEEHLKLQQKRKLLITLFLEDYKKPS